MNGEVSHGTKVIVGEHHQFCFYSDVSLTAYSDVSGSSSPVMVGDLDVLCRYRTPPAPPLRHCEVSRLDQVSELHCISHRYKV